ncbi:MAG TPA: NADPH-dependent oxidoreductase [Candidatus Yonathbacteria bacterium]|nr:NADPH-dependent oxidoreductase [Candidatus Yonathbacteria bacterium]
MEKLFIPIILGTARKDRQSENATQFILGEAQSYGFNTELIDVRDYLWGETIPAWVEDERTSPWKDIVNRADGFIIVLPEYNHGYPGELKILLDGAFKEYAKKPVALCGVSGGGFGGTRVVENIRPILTGLALVPISNTLYFSKIEDIADKDGKISEQYLKDGAQKMFEELAWYGSALKTAKSN